MSVVLETVLAGIGGVSCITLLSAWLGKVWASRILEQDRARYQTQMESLLVDLRNRSEKQLFVHRLQFEKEFEVYSELWKELLRLGRATSPFRVLTIASGRTPEEDLEEFRQAYKALSDRFYFHRPFYAPEIYEHARSVLKSADTALKRDGRGQPTPAWTEESEKALQRINDDYVPAVCDAIRKRIFPAIVDHKA